MDPSTATPQPLHGFFVHLQLPTTLLQLFSLSLLFLFLITRKSVFHKFGSYNSSKIPRSYPLIGSCFAIAANKHRRVQWTSDVLRSTPNLTFVLNRPLGHNQIFTANPSNVQHMLRTHFVNYKKGEFTRKALYDLMGNGIFSADGENWKFQRQLASHEFNTRSLRKFVETVVDTELTDRLIPVLSIAAANNSVIDLQDLLQRFTFDNICMIAFGYDPAYLLPSFPPTDFANAFEEAVQISSVRFNSMFPLIWKLKKLLNIGSEKRLRIAIQEVRDFAKQVIKEKKREPKKNRSLESTDLLSRFLNSGHSDEDFVTDIVISFILAGRDTTSAALTWFFWLIASRPDVENEILKEIREKTECSSIYEEVKDMVYTHASICESMRLYPPVPLDTKEAMNNDVLPDGTFVAKGSRVIYHPYAMGRVEKVWGPDWAEFRPERWLERDPDGGGKWSFVARDPYTYPVFQAGPRVCLGKEMAFLQMKRMVWGVLRQFRVVPVVKDGVEPGFIVYLTNKMKGGFRVKFEERV